MVSQLSVRLKRARCHFESKSKKSIEPKKLGKDCPRHFLEFRKLASIFKKWIRDSKLMTQKTSCELKKSFPGMKSISVKLESRLVLWKLRERIKSWTFLSTFQLIDGKRSLKNHFYQLEVFWSVRNCWKRSWLRVKSMNRSTIAESLAMIGDCITSVLKLHYVMLGLYVEGEKFSHSISF